MGANFFATALDINMPPKSYLLKLAVMDRVDAHAETLDSGTYLRICELLMILHEEGTDSDTINEMFFVTSAHEKLFDAISLPLAKMLKTCNKMV